MSRGRRWPTSAAGNTTPDFVAATWRSLRRPEVMRIDLRALKTVEPALNLATAVPSRAPRCRPKPARERCAHSPRPWPNSRPVRLLAPQSALFCEGPAWAWRLRDSEEIHCFEALEAFSLVAINAEADISFPALQIVERYARIDFGVRLNLTREPIASKAHEVAEASKTES